MEAASSIFMVASPIQLFTEQAPKEMVLGSGLASEMKTGVASEGVTPNKLGLEESSDLKVIESYFTALEREIDHLQQLHQEHEEEHRLELITLERERVQERMEWEREWREKEEALISWSGLVSRQRLMADIRSRSAPLVSTKQLAGTTASKEAKPWWTWLCLKKRWATREAAPQDASSSAGASKDSKGDAFDLQKLIELERRVRKAEAKKQQKSQAKAKKKAQKMERRRAKKEAKKTKRKDKSEEGTQPKRWWHR